MKYGVKMGSMELIIYITYNVGETKNNIVSKLT